VHAWRARRRRSTGRDARELELVARQRQRKLAPFDRASARRSETPRGWRPPSFPAQYSTQHTAWIGGFNPLKIAYSQSAFRRRWPALSPGAQSLVGSSGSRDRLSFLGLVIVASIHLARLGPAGKLCALLANGPLGLAAFGSLVGAEIFDVRNLLEIAPFTAIVVAYAINACLDMRASLWALWPAASRSAPLFKRDLGFLRLIRRWQVCSSMRDGK
jgi:hypothetical protein